MISVISEYLRERGCIVKNDESLKEYNTFKIGGTARLLAMPEDCETLAGLMRLIKRQGARYYILGGGSNVLISEEYFDGVFVVTSRMNNIEVRGDYMHADCGASLNRLAGVARDHGLSGFEFAYGIPGTLGGAVYMNAGAYGGQMSDIVRSGRYLDLDSLEVREIDAAAHEFSYRHSVFSSFERRVLPTDERRVLPTDERRVPPTDERRVPPTDERRVKDAAPYNALILSSVLKLARGDKSEIEAAMQANMAARREKQPLEYASAGSIFKRGENYFAARVIEDCGLKGLSVGGAQVSVKHSGFIVNTGDASFSDVLELIGRVQSKVLEQTGIKLEREVKIIEWKY